MKARIAMLLSIGLTAALQAAPLSVVEVESMDIDCLFSPTCDPLVQETRTPIPLPGIVGSAFLRTHVFTGEHGTPTAGLYGYLYCLDLRGCDIDENHNGGSNCFTNRVRCETNQVDCFTNVVVCQTNVTLTNVFMCVTNRLPATNIVCCITNRISAMNAEQCFPTHWGGRFCCIGAFPATNIVTCVTNFIPARNVIVCQQAFGWVTNVSHCFTNMVPGKSNVVTCVTNRVPCNGTNAACVRSININFGRIVSSLDFDGDNYPDDAFLLTEGFGSIVPSSVNWSNGIVTINFDPPICPRDTSFCVGLVSSNAPTNVVATVRLSNGSTLQIHPPGPRGGPGGPGGPKPIDCDFSRLKDAISDLILADLIGPNANSKAGRRSSLLGYVRAAEDAAEAGDFHGVLDALDSLIAKVDGEGRNDWVTAAAGRRLLNKISDLIECIRDHENGHDDGHDDDYGH